MQEAKIKEAVCQQNFSKLETAQLEELLRMDYEDIAPLDSETISAITTVLAERHKDVGKIKPADEAFAIFKKYYLPTSTKTVEMEELEPTLSSAAQSAGKPPLVQKTNPWRFVRNCAAIIALSFAFTAVIPTAFGLDNVFTILGKWTDSIFSFMKENIPDSETKNDLNDLASVVNAVCDTTAVVPTWLPDGFTLYTIESYGDEACSSVFATFIKEEQRISFQYTTLYDDQTISYEKDSSCVSIYTTNSQPFYIMNNDDSVFCTWASGNIECHIFGDIAPDDIFKIIDSIYTN